MVCSLSLAVKASNDSGRIIPVPRSIEPIICLERINDRGAGKVRMPFCPRNSCYVLPVWSQETTAL